MSRVVSRILLVAAAATSLWLIGVPTAHVQAIDLFSNACQSPGAKTNAAVCQDRGSGSSNPLTGSNGLIRKGATVTALGAGIAGVIIMILAGLTYITANGETGKVKQAQDMIKYTFAGLIVIALADSIVSFVLGKL
jgi:lipopolysaccharide export system protein LptC